MGEQLRVYSSFVTKNILRFVFIHGARTSIAN
jgi:hypothetical protein